MNLERILTVLREPYISEKTTELADKNKQFVFKVLNSATKKEIRAAVEHLFNVQVSNVTVLNVKGKKKRFRQSIGQRKDWRKAIVSLKEGFDIEFTAA